MAWGGEECEFLRGEATHPILSQAKPQAADELLWACARWSWEGFRVLPGIPGAHIAMRGHSRKNVARIKWWGRPDNVISWCGQGGLPGEHGAGAQP